MQVTRLSPDAYTVTFESEEELREEHRTNLSVGGLHLPTDDRPPLHARIEVTLRGPTGAEARIRATVVAPLPDGVALSIETEAGDLLERLLAGATEKGQTLADRLRNLPRVQKIIFAIGTGLFMASLDVRVALVHNPKTPPPFALRILPTLPDSEVRTIARGAATSMSLKQAALKRMQGR